MKKLLLLFIAMWTIALAWCNNASIVSHNLSRQSDYFEIPRRVIFYNGITNEYMLDIEWYCSLGWWDMNTPNEIWVVCKDWAGYKKHFLGLSNNVTYIVEQIDPANVSPDHYKVIFKPSAIVPSFEIK
jgi:NADH:ubiquinone oxidoreductase subunit